MMFIGGAASIDKQYRTEGETWWADEELSDEEMEHCKVLYKRVLPTVVISHEGPLDILNWMFPNKLIQTDIPISRTQRFLQELYEIHAPDVWIFGHWHQDIRHVVGCTTFQCLGIKSTVVLDTINLTLGEVNA